MAEYYIKRVGIAKGKQFFSVAKFEGGEQPTQIYFIAWHEADDTMHCDCPNRRRNKHVDDKHGKMVRSWLERGEPDTAQFPEQADNGTPF
jgi:hypothetical protein